MALLDSHRPGKEFQADPRINGATEFELPFDVRSRPAPADHADGNAGVLSGPRSAISLDTLTDGVALHRFLAEAKDIRTFLQRTHNLLHRIGITDFAHILLQNESEVKKMWIYPKKEHVQLQLYPQDIMIQHALISDKPLFQHQVRELIDNAPFENEIFAINRDIHKMVESFKIYDYYHIAFDSNCGHGRAIFSCGARQSTPEQFQQHISKYHHQLLLLARAIDSVGSTRFDLHANAQPSNSVVVHDKPLQLLNVLANKNLSLNDAARELNISISTANQHIAAAKRALGANTTAAAIVAAVKLGLITIDQ